MTYEFLPEAEKDLRDASRYYDQEASGMGHLFISEIYRSVQEDLLFPQAGVQAVKIVRKKQVRRFPFSVLYSIENELIVIIAVAHHKRRPTYWRRRVFSRRSAGIPS